MNPFGFHPTNSHFIFNKPDCSVHYWSKYSNPAGEKEWEVIAF